jgi:hypothetical protein
LIQVNNMDGILQIGMSPILIFMNFNLVFSYLVKEHLLYEDV